MRLCDLEYDRVVHETEKAVLLSIDGKEVWLPRSVIELDTDSKVVTLPEQMALNKELI